MHEEYTLPNGFQIQVPGAVHSLFGDGVRFYIILTTVAPETITDNVLCVSGTGESLWRIEDILPQRANSFAVGRIRENGVLEFFNTDGCWISVDKETGKATGFRIERFGPGFESEIQRFDPITWRKSDKL